ncbi:hypothetical protein [Candidatus Portiera aleyrodidarum]|nr:hypothetical protein [Candidatus Portiera aleyrodidarum]
MDCNIIFCYKSFFFQFIGQKIRKINIIQHLLEANMRYEMTRIRENS